MTTARPGSAGSDSVPRPGTEFLTPEQAEKKPVDFLAAEVSERLAQGPVEFLVLVQVAEDGDEVTDSTAIWPEKRQLTEFGIVTLTERVDELAPERRKLIFDPVLPIFLGGTERARWSRMMNLLGGLGPGVRRSNPPASAAPVCRLWAATMKVHNAHLQVQSVCVFWKTLDKNVAALQDRGHGLLFQPGAAEVHAQAGIYRIRPVLHCFVLSTMRP